MNMTMTRWCAIALAGLGVACGDGKGGDDAGTGGAAFGGELEFAGQRDLLPGLDVDSGWIPAESPASVRAQLSAAGGVSVTARATTDGQTMTPVPGSGEVVVEGALTFEVSARLDTSGFEYEGVVESFEYAIPSQTEAFEPFVLEQPVVAAADLPAQELGTVPIPSVPGASLVLAVAGGELSTQFVGTCAETAGDLGQYTGTLAVSGTVALTASIVIEVPIVGDETFGPFDFDLPIPETRSALDLGVRSLSTGDPVEGRSVCDVGGGSADTAAGDGGTTGDGGSDGTGGAGPGGDSSGATSDGTTGDPGTTTGTPVDGDPDYPPVTDGACPPEYIGVTVDDPQANAVCLPPCGAAGSCPSGVTGSAVGVCVFHPDSTYLPCTVSDDCSAAEICLDGICLVDPPSHCVLSCDDMTSLCPDAMTCIGGACSYLE